MPSVESLQAQMHATAEKKKPGLVRQTGHIAALLASAGIVSIPVGGLAAETLDKACREHGLSIADRIAIKAHLSRTGELKK